MIYAARGFRWMENWPRQAVKRVNWPVAISLPKLALVAVLFFAAVGCSIRMEVGRRPNLDPLEASLRAGQSTSADVLAALGPPHGKGMTMLPIDPTPRNIWSYYYEEGSMEDDRRIFLFVFFVQDRYDGYMWFSSLPR
jgi:hypothetical protein